MNIDFTDELDYESRPHRNMWFGMIVSAFEEAVSESKEPEARIAKYQALDWFYKDFGRVEIDVNTDHPFIKDVDFKYAREYVADMAGQDIKSWQDRLTRSIMHRYMEDHITDGPQTPEDAAEMWDAIFDRLEPDEDEDRQREIDDA